eukprot:scaffold745_cov54-Phaeocystis_antarctica.AAC.2
MHGNASAAPSFEDVTSLIVNPTIKLMTNAQGMRQMPTGMERPIANPNDAVQSSSPRVVLVPLRIPSAPRKISSAPTMAACVMRCRGRRRDGHLVAASAAARRVGNSEAVTIKYDVGGRDTVWAQPLRRVGSRGGIVAQRRAGAAQRPLAARARRLPRRRRLPQHVPHVRSRRPRAPARRAVLRLAPPAGRERRALRVADLRAGQRAHRRRRSRAVEASARADGGAGPALPRSLLQEQPGVDAGCGGVLQDRRGGRPHVRHPGGGGRELHPGPDPDGKCRLLCGGAAQPREELPLQARHRVRRGEPRAARPVRPRWFPAAPARRARGEGPCLAPAPPPAAGVL